MLTRDLNDYATVSLGLSPRSKKPFGQELFMNGGTWLPTGTRWATLKLGTERADGIDLTFSFERNGWRAQLRSITTALGNYIYLRDETEEEHEAQGAPPRERGSSW
ncbi:MAG: hypothetical protein CM15mP84_10600 [Cellvibrionales bacterium]|nr:MAG: hypothetical protein CM15mP84_10600 [Cellvibrionales bacterium]